MDWYVDRFTVRYALVRHAGRIGAGLAALLLLIALASAQAAGPSLFNLLTGPDGARNLLGYPGAMLGGSLRDLFGGSALLVPALVFNWSLSPRGRPALPWYVLHSLALTGALAVAVAALAALGAAEGWFGGMVGQAGLRWMQATTGAWAGLALVLVAGGYALTRVVYLRQARLAWRDLTGFLRFGGQHLREAWRGAAQQGAGLGHAALALGGALGAGLLGQYRARWYRLLSQLRAGRETLRAQLGPPRHAVSRVKASSRRARAGRAGDETTVLGTLGGYAESPFPPHAGGAAGDDSFDAWFESVDPPPAPRDSEPPPTAPAPADNPAAEPYRQWQERLARYRDNLDLDWHGRGKFPEARDPFTDDEEAADAEEA
jgi:hypothetical protein